MNNQDLLSTSQVAEILNISRIAVFKMIKRGKLKAFKIGRNYAIPRSELGNVFETELSKSSRLTMTRAINRVMRDYLETLKLLAKE